MAETYKRLLARVRALFAAESGWTRFKVWGRLRSIDFTRVLEELPERGTLFDFGCGHGAFAALACYYRPELRVVACDYSEDKLAVGRRCLPESLPIEIHAGSALPEPSTVDAVTMLDVLHYVPFEEWEDLLAGVAGALRPGGVFLLKDHDPGMPLKFRWNSVFERMTTSWNKVARRSDLTFKPREWFRERLGGLGLTVDVERLDRGTPFSHVLYVARKA